MNLRKKIGQGHVALGLQLNFPIASIIESIGSNWDWIWIDAQHGQHDYPSILECVRAADTCGTAPIVRIPSHEYGFIGRVMDMKPAGLMVPMVNDSDQAKDVVNAMRFPPLGQRSFGGRRVIDVQGHDYYKTANEDTILMAQIETKQAVNNAEQIAATEGVDVLFFGSDDIKVSLGIPVEIPVLESDEVIAAIEKTAVAAKNAGKVPGCVAPTPELMKMYASLGYLYIVGIGDVALLKQGSAAKLDQLKQALIQSL